MLRRALTLFASTLLISVLSQAEITGLFTFPDGESGEVQFNSDGIFAGSEYVVFSTSTEKLTVLTVPEGTQASFADYCSSATHVGRVAAFSDQTTGEWLYVCESSGNWTQQGGSGGGGGSASLEVFNNFDATRTSPTASISLSDAFRGTVTSSTYTFRINFSSVASVSALADYFPLTSSTTLLTTSSATANYVTHSSVSANYLSLSSATANYVSHSSVSANYLTLSSATATYLNKLSPYVSSVNVTSALSITNNGTAGSTPQIGVNFSSVASQSDLTGFIENRNTLQDGATFYVSSGTIKDYFMVGDFGTPSGSPRARIAGIGNTLLMGYNNTTPTSPVDIGFVASASALSEVVGSTISYRPYSSSNPSLDMFLPPGIYTNSLMGVSSSLEDKSINILSSGTIKLWDGTTDRWVALRSQDVVSSSYTIQLPDAPGTAGQVLSINSVSDNNLITEFTNAASGGGGGSPLQVFNNFDATNSSPTLSISASDAFRGTVSGSTYSFRINFSSVASVSSLADYLPLTSTPTFLATTTAASTYLTQSSATATYIQVETGDISAVTAGAGLSGGGTSGAVTLSLDPNATHYIHNQNTLQSGSTFYVSSGTVDGKLEVKSLDIIDLSVGTPARIDSSNDAMRFYVSSNSTKDYLTQIMTLSKASGSGSAGLLELSPNGSTISFRSSTGLQHRIYGIADTMVVAPSAIGSSPGLVIGNNTSGTDMFLRFDGDSVDGTILWNNDSSSFTVAHPWVVTSSMSLSGGYLVQNVVPTSGQVLTFDGAKWAPGTPAGSGDVILASSQTHSGWKNFASPAGSTFTYGVVAGSFTSTGSGVGKLTLKDSDGSNFASIESSGTLAYNQAYVLPDSTGTAGQVLAIRGVDGNGKFGTYWTTAAGAGDAVLAATQTFSGFNTFQGSTTFSGARSTTTFANFATNFTGVSSMTFNSGSALALLSGSTLAVNGAMQASGAYGSSGQFLQSAGAGAPPVWATASGGSADNLGSHVATRTITAGFGISVSTIVISSSMTFSNGSNLVMETGSVGSIGSNNTFSGTNVFTENVGVGNFTLADPPVNHFDVREVVSGDNGVIAKVTNAGSGYSIFSASANSTTVTIRAIGSGASGNWGPITAANLAVIEMGTSRGFLSSGSTIYFYTGSDNPISSWVNGAERMRIDSTGLTVHGLSPGVMYTVAGSSRVETAATGVINVSTNPVDWTLLKNVPAGFADGTDDGGGGGDAVLAATQTFSGFNTFQGSVTFSGARSTTTFANHATNFTGVSSMTFNSGSALALLSGSTLAVNGAMQASGGYGSSGQFLQSAGAGAPPVWATASGGSADNLGSHVATMTITAGFGISATTGVFTSTITASTITTTGRIILNNVGITRSPQIYASANDVMQINYNTENQMMLLNPGSVGSTLNSRLTLQETAVASPMTVYENQSTLSPTATTYTGTALLNSMGGVVSAPTVFHGLRNYGADPEAAEYVIGRADGVALNSTTDYFSINVASVGANAGSVRIHNLDCSGNTNGGAITADADGNLTCSDDDSGGGGGSETRPSSFTYVFNAEQAGLGKYGLTPPTISNSTGEVMGSLLFDETSTMTVVYSTILKGYQGGQLAVDFLYTSSATSGTVNFGAYIQCDNMTTAALDTASFGSINSTSTVTNATTGRLTKATVALTNGDSCADGDMAILKVERSAGSSDTMVGFARLRKIFFYEQ